MVKSFYEAVRQKAIPTYYANQDTFGSGNEEINKSQRSEIKAQIKYKF